MIPLICESLKERLRGYMVDLERTNTHASAALAQVNRRIAEVEDERYSLQSSLSHGTRVLKALHAFFAEVNA